MKNFSAVVRTVTVGLLMGFAGSVAAQQDYPNKPIRLIVPFPPGGSTTIIARLIGQKLTESWGQQVIVDNRGGGNTIIGTEALAKSAPDGYTILLVTSTHIINPSLLTTPYDALKDFAPVATVVGTETLMVLSLSVPANNLLEFIALGKAKPGEINYASSGSGTTNHLAGELFCILAGVKMQHVPYKGAGPATTDIIGGQVQMFMNNAVPLIPLVKSAKMRAVAISGPNRLIALPEVPTFAQAGLPSFDGKSWQGILAPAGTPKAVVDKLSREIAKILATPEFVEKLAVLGAEPFVGSSEQFSELLKTDMVKYARIIKAANIKLD